METIGSRIAMFRNSRRWTQEKLATEIQIKQSLLSDIENDKISPKWDLINKIAESLEIPVINLLPTGTNIMYNQYSNHSGHIIQSGDLVNHNTSDTERILWEHLLQTKEELIKSKEEIIQALRAERK